MSPLAGTPCDCRPAITSWTLSFTRHQLLQRQGARHCRYDSSGEAGNEVVIVDETQKVVKEIYEKTPFTKKYFQK
jgi:hypothetical protein